MDLRPSHSHPHWEWACCSLHIPILIYQGGVSLLAGQLNAIITDPMMAEMTATGGILLMGVGVSNLLEIKKIRVGNFLPALAIAPLIVWVLSLLKN